MVRESQMEEQKENTEVLMEEHGGRMGVILHPFDRHG